MATINENGKIIRDKSTVVLQVTNAETEARRYHNINPFDNEFKNKLKCTKCFSSYIRKGRDCTLHPILKVPFCKSCSNFYGDGDFSLDEDDEDKYCRWCGEGGELFICSKCICGFCPKCIKKNLGKAFFKTVEDDDDWVCLICKPEPIWELRHVIDIAMDHFNIKESNSMREAEPAPSQVPGKKKKRALSCAQSVANDDEGTIKMQSKSEDMYPKSKQIVKLLKFVKISSHVCLRNTEKLLNNSRTIKSEEDYNKLLRRVKRFNTVLDLNEKIVQKAKNKIRTVFADDEPEDKHETSLNDSMALEVVDCVNLLNDSYAEGTVDNEQEADGNGLEVRDSDDVQEADDNGSGVRGSDDVQEADGNGPKVRDSDDETKGQKLLRTDSGPNSITAETKNAAEVVEMGVGSLAENSYEEGDVKSVPSGLERVVCVLEKELSASKQSPCSDNTRNADCVNSLEERDKSNETISSNQTSSESPCNKNMEESEVAVSGRTSNTKGKDDKCGVKVNGHIDSNSLSRESGVEERCDVAACDIEVVPEKTVGDVEVVEDDRDIIFVQSRKSPMVVSLSEETLINDDDYIKSTDNEGDSGDENKLNRKGGKLNPSRDSGKRKSERMKKTTVLLSSDNSDSSDGDEPFRRTSLIARRKKTPTDREKRLSRRKSELDEDAQVKRMTNLKSLKRKIKSYAESEDGQDVAAIKETREEEKTPQKEKEKREKKENNNLMDMVRELLSDSESEHSDSSQRSNDSYVNFYENNKKLVKDAVLGTSSGESDASEIAESDVISSTPISKNQKKASCTKDDRERSSSEEGTKKKKSMLIISDSDSGNDESSKRKRILNSDSDVTELEETGNKISSNKKRRRIRVSSTSSEDITKKDKAWKRIANLSSESDMEVEVLSQKSPAKGRKNIRGLMKNDQLTVETKVAVKDEEKRKEKLAKRAEEFKKLFGDDPKQLILDFNEKGEVIVSVAPRLVKHLKQHQKDGVKFMWDNCFESLAAMQSSNGGGCILAHCMGLGKTLQVIALVHTVLTSDIGVSTVLVVCPLNTVANWMNEFEMWLQTAKCETIDIYDLNKYKKLVERRFQLKTWHEEGGVLIISYDMYRNLTKKKIKGVVETSLIRPGPDLVVCDEGHLLKNEASMLSKCMSQIQTARRIVLTGTPLQNNLKEYHCMVQFVKPSILGNIKEFMNRFVNPIENGQFEDSTAYDVKLMKRRSHVLHNMLEGCIHRRDYSVLTPFLPEKHEYAISIKLAEEMSTLYRYYIDNLSGRSTGSKTASSLFHDYHALQRIWTHPITMQAQFETNLRTKAKRIEEEDIDDFINDSDSAASSVKSSSSSSSSSSKSSKSCVSIKSVEPKDKKKVKTRRTRNNKGSESEVEEEKEKEKEKPWWHGMVRDDIMNDMTISGKIMSMFTILEECEKLGDKLLVFSQSLYTLDFIEHFLNIKNEAGEDWTIGINYFRLDGSSTSERRAHWCKIFNRPDNKAAKLFLISTRAGGLGINLVGANRVIIFDASWNPSHDLQSIFRIYRFGQVKPCYIYRFLAEATMEEKIYERQITKLSLAHRVVDEHQIERHYTMGNLQELYKFEPLPKDKWKTPIVPKDIVLAAVLKKHEDSIVSYLEHDSLLENKAEEELNEEERLAAWEDYENCENAQKRQMDYMAHVQELRLQMMQSIPPGLNNQIIQLPFKSGAGVTPLRAFAPRVANAATGTNIPPVVRPQVRAIATSKLMVNPFAARQDQILRHHQEEYQKNLADMQKNLQVKMVAQAQLQAMQAKGQLQKMTAEQLLAFGSARNILPFEGENMHAYRSRLIASFNKKETVVVQL